MFSRVGNGCVEFVFSFAYITGAVTADDVMRILILLVAVAVCMIALRLRIVAAECAGSAVGKVMRRCLFEGGLACDAVNGMEFRIHHLIDDVEMLAAGLPFIAA